MVQTEDTCKHVEMGLNHRMIFISYLKCTPLFRREGQIYSYMQLKTMQMITNIKDIMNLIEEGFRDVKLPIPKREVEVALTDRRKGQVIFCFW